MRLHLPCVSDGSRHYVMLCGALVICFLTFVNAAQARQRSAGIPRVGTIKDYPTTGLMTGCGNLYFYPVARTDSSPEAYVFVAHGDGSNAWMNLSGKDVRLRQIKTTTRSRQKARQFNYRYGDLRISVVVENFKPANAAAGQADPMFKMKITLLRGRNRLIVRAVGDADC
ncbi:MAG TPA: hypothetical protein VLL54_07420 [Pyrinomonadaceae bacterium]|nr:hypothetical protein [Pyrinomonadaceae bacterium]